MTLCDFGKKVLDFFVSNSEEEETILFVLDDDSYSRLFENNDDKNDFEIRIKTHLFLILAHFLIALNYVCIY